MTGNLMSFPILNIFEMLGTRSEKERLISSLGHFLFPNPSLTILCLKPSLHLFHISFLPLPERLLRRSKGILTYKAN